MKLDDRGRTLVTHIQYFPFHGVHCTGLPGMQIAGWLENILSATKARGILNRCKGRFKFETNYHIAVTLVVCSISMIAIYLLNVPAR